MKIANTTFGQIIKLIRGTLEREAKPTTMDNRSEADGIKLSVDTKYRTNCRCDLELTDLLGGETETNTIMIAVSFCDMGGRSFRDGHARCPCPVHPA
jgi:hypothetical protein